MQKHPKDFLAETVDEQIEHLSHAENATPDSRVVQSLQRVYEQGDAPEQVRRSLNTIWSRLSDHLSPANQTIVSMPETDLLRVLPRDKWEQQVREPFGGQDLLPLKPLHEQQERHSRVDMPAMNTLPARPIAHRAHKSHVRRAPALSVLAALVLLSVCSWALVAHLYSQASIQLGSGPGTPAPTISITPTPQSLRDQAHQLLRQFHQEVKTWGQTHQYQDPFNDKSYELTYAYDQQGLGAVLDNLVAQAKSDAEYQQASDQIQQALTNLHALESNASDQTPWNQMHSSDSSLLHYYRLTSGTVVVVSLLEQSMRVYHNGQLINAFQVVTGRYEVPSLPGFWHIINRVSPTTLVSPYLPPTPVHYALWYHSAGYLIYDSSWRTVYGVGGNFPHNDPARDARANNGSDGGINLSLTNMTWLYANVQMHIPVVIY